MSRNDIQIIMHIIVTGSLAFDQIMLYPGAIADHIKPDMSHIISTSFMIDHLEKNQGGTAGNICYNLGLLGEKAVCLASIGKDGADYVNFLEKNNVNTQFIQKVSYDYSASFVVITDEDNCQISGFYEGAMKKDTDLALGKCLEELVVAPEDIFLVLAPTKAEAMAKYIHEAIEAKIHYLFSPSQQIPNFSREDMLAGITGADIIIGNDYEISQMLEKAGLTEEQFLDRGSIVIKTLGGKGSMIHQKGKQEIIVGTAKPRQIQDPTGIGDAYIAGFLSGYVNRKSLIECGQMGATAASYVLEEYGTTNHSFSRPIFDNRMRENFG